VNPFDEEDPKKYKQITIEKVKKARKFLQITFVDARAIKNRLGASSISELIDAYREYEQNNKLDQLEVIIQESLCSKPRRQFFMDIIKRTLEMEEREHINYKTKGLRAAELNHTTYSNKTQSMDDPLSELMDENGNPLTTEAEYLFSMLPFWYVDYTVPNEKTEILRDKFKMDRDICAAVQRITKMKTLNDLVSYYRQNRTVKDYSLFTPEEVKALKDRGWTKEAVEKFIKAIVQLAKESLLVPKYVFQLVRPDADIENLELDGIKGLPLGAISGIVGSLIANDKKLKKLKLKNMGLNTDSTFILQLLVANPINELIELDFSKNPIKDDGVINILKAFKANPKDNVQIIRFDECWMGSQGASSFSSYLRQTNFSTSLIPIQVLTLSGNQIGNVGFETLCFTLKSNTTLKYLDLSNNSITGKITSISALISMLQINKTLKVLYLVGNKFDSDNTIKLLDEFGAINQPTALAILKIGPLITTADNVAKFIEFGLAGLSNLRYCEITSPAILNDQYSNIDRVVKGLKGNRVVRATADTIVQEGKRLINLLSDMIYGGITLKETVQLQGNTNNPKVAEFYENLFQEIAENKFKIYTTECIALLTESYIAYDYELKRGDTFIHRMAQYGHIEAVKYLLESDADPNSRTSLIHPDFPYATLLHVAVASGSLDLIKQLLTRQAIIDAKDMNENSPLHYGASLGKAEICDFLMTRGCAPNVKNKKRMEPMHAAILSDDIKTIEVFIKKMNPYLKPEWTREFFERKVNKGHTGLMLAVEDGAVNSFHYILRYGVKLNDTDEKGRTALHYAVEFDRYEMIDSLLRNRTNTNVKDITGETPLFLAVRKGDMDVIQKLYDFQSRLDVANTKGDTLLHEAAKANNTDLIAWLLERGLDWRKTNFVGKIPRDYATSKGAKELLPDQQSLPQYNMYADDNDIFTSPILNNTNANNNQSSPGSPDANKANGVGEDVDDDDEPYYNDDDVPQYNPQKAPNLPSAMVPTEENRYPRQGSDTSMIQQSGINNNRTRSNTRPGQSGPVGYDVNTSGYQPKPPQRQYSNPSGGSGRSQTPQKYQGQTHQPDNVNKTMIDGSYIDTMDDQSRRLNKIKPNGSNLPPLANNGKADYKNQESKNFPEASKSYYSFLSDLSDPKKVLKETNGLPKIDNVNKRK
jgi:ankyrin repeat protein